MLLISNCVAKNFFNLFRESYNLISVINSFQMVIVDGKNELLNLLVLQNGILSMPTLELRMTLTNSTRFEGKPEKGSAMYF